MVKDLPGPFLLATAIAFLVGALMSGEVEASSLSRENGLGWAAAWSACDGTIGECLGGEETEEMAMDSESNRRILVGTGNYVGYGVGKRDLILCGIHGAPNSNCRPSAVLNPYEQKRFCSIAERCGGRGLPDPPALGTLVRG
ncbi:hypothetical protein EJ110_NYTH10619 [Nymphaea thermarum]|nr:hypothetical protein EJ110_NYTH10619 [Nymphaea thermarum]